MPTIELKHCLARLIETAGVSGAEDQVAAVIRSYLEEAGYSGKQISTDQMGNLWVRVGPESAEPQRIYIAHMDEIGLRVTRIRDDGRCYLEPVGGLDPQLWEGTSVVVHGSGKKIRGCIAPVSHHISYGAVHAAKQRIDFSDLILDIGAESAEAARSMGVSVLDPVTWDKRLDDVGAELVQARSLDDRFGCCALVMLAESMLSNPPDVPAVIAWSVQEEVGLKGAEALADRFAGVTEAIAVDSFTVGAGPRDIKRYEAVHLGAGAVLRSWDRRMLVRDATRHAILQKAAALGSELQYGFMPGGNDAAPFVSGDARRFCFSVAVQYSHSQVERINLNDLRDLVRLLEKWTASPIEL